MELINSNPLERSIGGWRQKTLLPLIPLTCENKRNYVEYQYWLWTNKTLKTAQCLVNTTTYTRTSPGVMSILQHALMGAQNYWRLVWPITMKMRSSKGTPSSSRQLHPHLPLNCFMFNIRACAGRSTHEKSSITRAFMQPSGVSTSMPRSMQHTHGNKYYTLEYALSYWLSLKRALREQMRECKNIFMVGFS